MISSRLSKNSYSLQEFNKTIPKYQLALEKSGYREKLTYVKEQQKKTDQFNSTSKNRSKNRTRKIIWFNPLSMKKSTLTLVKNFLPSSINNFPHFQTFSFPHFRIKALSSCNETKMCLIIRVCNKNIYIKIIIADAFKLFFSMSVEVFILRLRNLKIN